MSRGGDGVFRFDIGLFFIVYGKFCGGWSGCRVFIVVSFVVFKVRLGMISFCFV